MRVELVTGARSAQPMGLEAAELRLLEALRREPGGLRLDVRVLGGRSAWRYARRIRGRWRPARPGWRAPAVRARDVAHLLGMDIAPPRRGRFVATVYDLAALRFQDEGRLPPWTEELVGRAAGIVVPSRFTASELTDLLGVAPERIHVVPQGPGQRISPVASAAMDPGELAQLGLRRPFVLRMGGYTRRKNVALLLRAWPQVHRRTGATLALVGPPQAARAQQLQAARPDGVVVLDYVEAELMARLLITASAVASPSVYEGFGLPPLEAMAAGTPVVAVRAGAVAETCQEAALLVDDDPEAFSEALVRVLSDEPLRAELIERGRRRARAFTWATAAAAHVSLYREIGARR